MLTLKSKQALNSNDLMHLLVTIFFQIIMLNISINQHICLHFLPFLLFVCSKTIFQSDNIFLTGETFQTFQPNTQLESMLIDLWTLYLNDQLDQKDIIRRICIPTYTTVSQIKFQFLSFMPQYCHIGVTTMPQYCRISDKCMPQHATVLP